MDMKLRYSPACIVKMYRVCVLWLVVFVLILSYKLHQVNEGIHCAPFSTTDFMKTNHQLLLETDNQHTKKPLVMRFGEQNNFNQSPTKRVCYNLNWTERALTSDVFSKCGFISIQESLGRSGNNMFEVAALFGTAYKLDLIPIVHPSFPLLEHYNVPNVMNISLLNVTPCAEEEKIRKYTECLPGRTNVENRTMTGYRQSWKYFHDIEEDIAKIFGHNFKTNSLSKASEFLRNVSNSSYQHVGIHIRRTDMHEIRVNNPVWDRVAGIEYFNRAMTYFDLFYKHVQFIIVSDDIGWAKIHLVADDIFYSPFTSLTDDLALMSLCDHMIVTYGTFGWWGAWLANGTTVFFRESFQEPRKLGTVRDDHYLISGSIELP